MQRPCPSPGQKPHCLVNAEQKENEENKTTQSRHDVRKVNLSKRTQRSNEKTAQTKSRPYTTFITTSPIANGMRLPLFREPVPSFLIHDHPSDDSVCTTPFRGSPSPVVPLSSGGKGSNSSQGERINEPDRAKKSSEKGKREHVQQVGGVGARQPSRDHRMSSQKSN